MTQDLFDLTRKVALVTGATHGLGMAMATALANAGAKIVVNDIVAERLEAAKKEYATNGINISTYVCDVTNEKQVIDMLAKIEARRPTCRVTLAVVPDSCKSGQK